jgi:dipeptidase E
MSQKIVAIGGGKLVPEHTTIRIDSEILELTKKEHPEVLFIPTASDDNPGYCARIKDVFEVKLGARVSNLLLWQPNPDLKKIREIIMKSDVIYVGGGNTVKMITKWKKLGVDKMLHDAWQKGVVMSGLSAGAICWFNYGSSDSRRTEKNPKADLIKATGLGFVPFGISPHHFSESDRKDGAMKIMSKTAGFCICLDDHCAIEIVDEHYRFLSMDASKYGAYKAYKKHGKVHYDKLTIHKEFREIKELYI